MVNISCIFDISLVDELERKGHSYANQVHAEVELDNLLKEPLGDFENIATIRKGRQLNAFIDLCRAFS